VTRLVLTEEQRRQLAAEHAWARPVTDEAGADLRTPRELLEGMLTRYSADSRGDYRTTIEQFFDWMELFQPQTPILEVKPGHIEKFEAFLANPGGLAQKNEPPTIEVKRNRISAFFKYCIAQERVPRNPVVRLPGSSGKRRPQRKAILLPDQISATLAEARRESYRALVIDSVLVGMGLRISELHDALVENVRQHAGGWTLTISRKGDTEEGGVKIEEEMQTLDVPHTLVPILEPWLEGRPEGPLIPGGTISRPDCSSPLSERAIYNTVVRVGGRAVPELKMYPHLLRHTSITLALTDPYAKVERVADYYGHSDLATVSTYNHHPLLPGAGHYPNPVGLDWRTQKGLTTAAD
jgi:integrase